jgi:hypothetical protein
MKTWLTAGISRITATMMPSKTFMFSGTDANFVGKKLTVLSPCSGAEAGSDHDLRRIRKKSK